MDKLESRKAIWFSLVLFAAMALIAWAFFSGGNCISASSEEKAEKKELKEKEIEIKVLDEGGKETEDTKESDILTKPDDLKPKDFEQYKKEFENTQREMEKMLDDLRKEHEQMMRDFGMGTPDKDVFGRDDWNITPRFPNMPRGGLFRFMPRDFGTDMWTDDFPGSAGKAGFATAMDVREDGEKIVIKCDLPGMEKDKIEVTLKGRLLTIKGMRETTKEQQKEEKGGKIILNERSAGAFSRIITLPSNADASKISSKYENGVLEIVVPKTGEKEPEEKKIIIKTE